MPPPQPSVLASIFHAHDPVLAGLSVALAVFASFMALELAKRVRGAAGRARTWWLVATGLAFGGGVWAMHFVAMLALELPFAVAYRLGPALLSLLIAVGFSCLGFHITLRGRGGLKEALGGGAVMGLGVVAMHYAGMAALILPAPCRYDPWVVALSVLIAITASSTALRLAARVESAAVQAGGALLMGVAVAGMHFTGMAAFICGPAAGHVAASGVSARGIAGGVVAITGLTLLAGLGFIIRDRAARQREWEQAVGEESRQRVDALLRHATDLIAIIGPDWRASYLSPASGAMAGLVGRIGNGGSVLQLLAAEEWVKAGALLAISLKNPARPFRGEFLADGGQAWFEVTLTSHAANRIIQGTIVNLRDITERKQAAELVEKALEQAQAARQSAESHATALREAHDSVTAAEQRARRLARQDALTGLPNRRVFNAELERTITRARDGGAMGTLLLIDLDDFKKINDLQGHQVGDSVLGVVAQRLQAAMRESDTVARLGGDEFAIITDGLAEADGHRALATRLAARLLETIRQPIRVDGTRCETGASIGVVLCREDSGSAGNLLRAADIAMYQAKKTGKAAYRVFDQAMEDELRVQEALERDLIRALRDGTILPHYQPLVDINTGRIHGFEALARWPHKVRGFIGPDEFIPMVEQLGLMMELTAVILRQSCRDAAGWPGAIRISVNFSPSVLRDAGLPGMVRKILAQEGLAPNRLEIEITETALVHDAGATKAILAELQESGVTVSLDDFGTGYSSLHLLHQLQFDKVKIDRSFIQLMRENDEIEKIVDAVLGLTSSLNLPVVAEGIETPDVLSLLAAKGCNFGQGYYLGKAMPGASVLALLATPKGADMVVS